MNFIKKIQVTIGISIQNYLVYRVNFLLEIFLPTLVYFIIRYNIWASIYSGYEADSQLYGYTLQEMLTFQCWALVVETIVYSFNALMLATDIRLGKITSHLLYPFSFIAYQFGKFLGLMVIQTIIALASLSLLIVLGFIPGIEFKALVAGTVVCMLGALLWYWISFVIGVLSFWMDETWFIRALLILIARLLGGALIPLEFFPDLLRIVSEILPFSYLVFFPAKIFMGDFSQFFQVVFVLSIWNIILIFLSVFIWRLGVRHYTAAGA